MMMMTDKNKDSVEKKLVLQVHKLRLFNYASLKGTSRVDESYCLLKVMPTYEVAPCFAMTVQSWGS